METSVSLLGRLQLSPDEVSWGRLDAIYRPLIRRWVLRDPSLRDDVDDLVQEVMSVLVSDLPAFCRQRTGSFRLWLRTITINRVKNHYRARQRRAKALGQSPLGELVDPASDLSRLGDREHDRHVLRRLLELIEPEFRPATVAAFRRTVLDGVEAARVADELGVSVNAVVLAKSRVLARLREEAEGLIDSVALP